METVLSLAQRQTVSIHHHILNILVTKKEGQKISGSPGDLEGTYRFPQKTLGGMI